MKCRLNFLHSPFAFHPVHPLYPVQRFWNPLNFEILGNLDRIKGTPAIKLHHFTHSTKGYTP